MDKIVQFPALGWEFSFKSSFSIGPIHIAWYGVIIALGLLLALIYAFKNFKRFGIDDNKAIDCIIWGIVGGIIGARLYFVAFSWSDYGLDFSSWEMFWSTFSRLFKTWEGGMAIYGGLIGALAIGLLACKIRKLKPLPMLDMVALGFLIGQGIGRWGNFINVEAFGSNTTLPWGMTSPSITAYLAQHAAEYEQLGVMVNPNLPVHPCFLYESLWCLLGFVLLHFYSKHRKFDGEIFVMYLGWYGFERMIIEGLRTDSLMIGSTLRVSQLLAAVLVVVSVIVWVSVRSKIKRQNDPAYLPLYVTTQEWKDFLARPKEDKKASQAVAQASEEEEEADVQASEEAEEPEESAEEPVSEEQTKDESSF